MKSSNTQHPQFGGSDLNALREMGRKRNSRWRQSGYFVETGIAAPKRVVSLKHIAVERVTASQSVRVGAMMAAH